MSRYCTGCNCKDCYNNEHHGAERSEAIKATLEKNPNAFQAKITKVRPYLSEIEARGGVPLFLFSPTPLPDH